MRDPIPPEHRDQPGIDTSNTRIMELLRRRARDRGNSVKWNTNTLLLTYVILAATMILAIRSVSLAVLALVAVGGLAIIWIFSQVQARRMEKAFLEEEIRAYSDLLSNQPQPIPEPLPEQQPAAQLPPESPLTDREIEVLNLIAEGKSNKEAAVELSISQQTVKNHISHIFDKLEVNDRTSAVLLAVRYGWVRSNGGRREPKTLDKEHRHQ